MMDDDSIMMRRRRRRTTTKTRIAMMMMMMMIMMMMMMMMMVMVMVMMSLLSSLSLLSLLMVAVRHAAAMWDGRILPLVLRCFKLVRRFVLGFDPFQCTRKRWATPLHPRLQKFKRGREFRCLMGSTFEESYGISRCALKGYDNNSDKY